MAGQRRCRAQPWRPIFFWLRTSLSKSASPIETPPEVRMTSQRAAADASICSSDSPASRQTPRSITSAGADCDAAQLSSVERLQSRILPGARGSSGDSSSSPVLRTPTTGRRLTDKVVAPTAANRPISAGVRVTGAATTFDPALISTPICRTSAPEALAPFRRRTCVVHTRRVLSHGTFQHLYTSVRSPAFPLRLPLAAARCLQT